MKKFFFISLLAVLLLSLTSLTYAQVLWLSAANLKQGKIIAMTEFYYSSLNKIYDTADEKWIDNPDTKSEWGFNSMIGYGITDRFDALIHIPFRNIAFENEDGTVEKDAMGVGDIWLKSQFAVIPWSKDKNGLAFLSTISLPTGSLKDDFTLGSGRIDFAIGEIFSTKWTHNWRGHIKANYWFSQNTGGTSGKDVGDNYEVILKIDKFFTKTAFAFVVFNYTQKWKDQTAAGIHTAWTQKSRYVIQPGITYIPKPGLFIRPKVAIPVSGEVGEMNDYKILVDVWYVFTTTK